MLFLLALLAPLVSAAPTKRWECASTNNSQCSLASLAERSGKLYFGTAYQSFYMAAEGFTPVLDSEFDQYTPENEMKWSVIQPEPNVFNWTGSDLIIAHAKKTGSIVRGHNFCWDSQTPGYVTNITDPDELKSVLKSHIDAVLGRYGNDLYAFDVINEPLNDNGTFKSNVWYNVLGEDYLGIALDYAHAAAPNLNLYINDYNIESVNNKSQAMAKVAQGLLAAGKPLNGIGFESHFIGGETPDDIAESMKQFTDLGLDVAITELDVRVPVNNMGIANSTWLEIQAKDYAQVVSVCLNNTKCPGVTVWGFADYFSWIPGVFAGYGAADLYGFTYQPKPAFYAVQDTL
ncbi:xylanase [Kockovaella imperatae]|uniref:Beta-xylanase n=1 Tax=Kockovaella imperatae TaxID=4999 RepID=A0A1Y1UL10_9TREE|nr:xylanase [Kockovaella imperatae]ORX38166.1 xylanase [Kockovaella imperatae]